MHGAQILNALMKMKPKWGIKKTMRCLWCKKELTAGDIIIGRGLLAYCKRCSRPIADMTANLLIPFLEKYKSELEYEEDIFLKMRGFII